MVGQMGIVWNRIQPWLMEVEQLRLQVGMAGAKGLIGGEFSPVVAVPWGMGTVFKTLAYRNTEYNQPSTTKFHPQKPCRHPGHRFQAKCR